MLSGDILLFAYVVGQVHEEKPIVFRKRLPAGFARVTDQLPVAFAHRPARLPLPVEHRVRTRGVLVCDQGEDAFPVEFDAVGDRDVAEFQQRRNSIFWNEIGTRTIRALYFSGRAKPRIC